MMMKDTPIWFGFGIHFLVDQQITGLGEDPDRFNPVLISVGRYRSAASPGERSHRTHWAQ